MGRQYLGALGSASGEGVNGSVYAIVEFRGDLVVGGRFSSIAGISANNIARWDGSH